MCYKSYLQSYYNYFEKQFLEFKETLLNSYQIVCEQRDQFIKNNVIVMYIYKYA